MYAEWIKIDRERERERERERVNDKRSFLISDAAELFSLVFQLH